MDSQLDRKMNRRYFAVSAISGAVDTALFVLLLLLLKKRSVRGYLLLAVICPRLVTVPLNFILHKRYTFSCAEKHCPHRYAIVCTAALTASCCSAGILNIFGTRYVLLLRPAADAAFGLLVRSANTRWVFAADKAGEFYGDYARIIKTVARAVLPEYSISGNIAADNSAPVVYVCRHGNMHGPITTLANFEQDIHPMVLGCFFEKDSCRNHFAHFTFSRRFGWSKQVSSVLARLSSALTVPIMHSLQAIPVYRDSRAISTLRTSLKYLKRGESVIVFPDVCYTASEGDGDIYAGFVTIGAMYLKATGRPLDFVPLVIDDPQRSITALDSYEWNSSSDRNEAADYLRRAIHTDNSQHESVAA